MKFISSKLYTNFEKLFSLDLQIYFSTSTFQLFQVEVAFKSLVYGFFEIRKNRIHRI